MNNNDFIKPLSKVELEVNKQAYEDKRKIKDEIDAVDSIFEINKEDKTIVKDHPIFDAVGYEVYSVDESGNKIKPPREIIYGVAGSNEAEDWQLNLSRIDVDRYEKLTNKEIDTKSKEYKKELDKYLEGLVAGEQNGHLPDHNVPLLLEYEKSQRKAVEQIKKASAAGIPVTIIGDSKGGEDASYLAIKLAKEGIDVDRLYLINPKTTRFSKKNYEILQKMADEGRLTIEIVYPEIMSIGGNTGSDVFCGSKAYPENANIIYTVPNSLGSYENHTIGSYEKDTYQGFNGEFRFQCSERPVKSGILDKTITYKISQVADSEGNVISVSEYFVQEKEYEINKFINELETIRLSLKVMYDLDIAADIKSIITNKMSGLKDKHASLIETNNSISTYIDTKMNQRLKKIDKFKEPIEYFQVTQELNGQYYREIDVKVDSESEYYKDIISESYVTKTNIFKDELAYWIDDVVKFKEDMQTLLQTIREGYEAMSELDKKIELTITKQLDLNPDDPFSYENTYMGAI